LARAKSAGIMAPRDRCAIALVAIAAGVRTD